MNTSTQAIHNTADGKCILSDEQERALCFMLSGTSTYIFGKAGTGKSAVLQRFRDIAGGNTAFASPTGIGARTIGGVTLHSLFQLPVGCEPGILENLPPHKDPEMQALLANIRTLVVDEISMVSSCIFASIERLLRLVPVNEYYPALPFGGRQIICVGDIGGQLPPVLDDEMLQYMEQTYGGPYAFNTWAWQAAGFVPVVMHKSLRQHDAEFVECIDGIRNRDPQSVARFNEIVPTSEPPEDAVVLCPRKARAEYINTSRDVKLGGDPWVLTAQQSGWFTDEMKPTHDYIELRPGSRIMMVAGSPAEGSKPTGEDYVNGDLGYVLDISPDKRQMAVSLDNGSHVLVDPYTWFNSIYRVALDPVTEEYYLEREDIGMFRQFPVRKAYAISVHKSQSVTLPKVHVELHTGMFAVNQLYTAVSRVRSRYDLSLDRPVQWSDIKYDQCALEFSNEMEQKAAEYAADWDANVMFTC